MSGASPEAASVVEALAAAIRDARERTLLLVSDLSDEQLCVPRLPIVNHLTWEVGHVAWFQETWVLRHLCGREPSVDGADAIFDSSTVPQATRWDLPLPRRAALLHYLESVRDLSLRELGARPLDERALYFHRLATFHEDMHGEAIVMTRQSVGHAAPPLPSCPASGRVHESGRVDASGPWPGDVHVPGGPFRFGTERGSEPFVFDNEKWAHDVDVAPFSIARAPVTQGEFAAFIDEGGYLRDDLWSDAGRAWRDAAGATAPTGWRRGASGWERRHFDRHVPLEPHHPVLHVNRHEAEGYCRLAGRRLPSEAEWEIAATFDPATGRKRRYPWGDDPPGEGHANLDGFASGCVDVAARPRGDSALGCRQMIGNAWEWTASEFHPFPGFSADPYADYSRPWFGTHAVLRGGSWVTRSRLIRAAFRNFYEPHRRDAFATFRTCAIS